MESKRKLLERQIENFEGDKRSKEYKYLKEELASLDLEVEQEEVVTPSKNKDDFKISDEVYNTIVSFNGKVRGDQLGWLFSTYNKIFNERLTKCLCAGKIKRMVAKIKVTYERERK